MTIIVILRRFWPPAPEQCLGIFGMGHLQRRLWAHPAELNLSLLLSRTFSFVILLVIIFLFFPEGTDVLPFQTQKAKFMFCYPVMLFDQKIVLTISLNFETRREMPKGDINHQRVPRAFF